jgi:hypothetical protein
MRISRRETVVWVKQILSLEQFVLLLSETRIENWIRQPRKKLSTLKWPLPHWLVYQTTWKVSNHTWILQLILKTCILLLAICVRWNLNFLIIGKWVSIYHELQVGFMHCKKGLLCTRLKMTFQFCLNLWASYPIQ